MNTDEVIVCQNCSSGMLDYRLFESIEDYIWHIKLEHGADEEKAMEIAQELRNKQDSNAKSLDDKDELHEKLKEMA